MKKLLLASMVTCCAPNAFADFIGVHGSISGWQSTFSGKIAGTKKLAEREGYGWGVPSFDERGFDEEQQLFGYLAFEHPIPLIPNVRLGFSKIEDSGTSQEEINTRELSIGLINGKEVYTTLAQDVYTELNIDALDVTLYYEILDNWVNLDLGLTVRQMTGEFYESSYIEFLPESTLGNTCANLGFSSGSIIPGGPRLCEIPPLGSTTDIDFIVPMLFGEVRFDIPLGFFVGGRAQAIAYSSNKVLDIEVEAGYMFDFTVMEFGAALGYRTSSLKADDLEGLYSDATLDGYYGSLKVHF